MKLPFVCGGYAGMISLINSAVAFSFSYGPQEVYEVLAPMINAKGVAYGYEE